jgi:hypothetical protein
MVNYVEVYLDTTAPATPTLSLDGGSAFASDLLVDCTIGTADGDTTGYMMKIWGTGIDTTYDLKIQDTELASDWITYSPTKQIKITEVNELKTINVRLRDQVENISGTTTSTISYDSTKPVVQTSLPDVDRISVDTAKNVVNFTFQVDSPFIEYRVKVVNSYGAEEVAGTPIPTTNGSINTSGIGTFDTTLNPINVTIYGADLQTASSGDSTKIIKVFVREFEGADWSS